MGDGFIVVSNPAAGPPEAPAIQCAQFLAAAERLSQTGQFAQAAAYLAQAAAIQPDNAMYCWQLGVCQWNAGQPAAARQSLESAVRIDPRLACAHSSLGGWYLLHGMVEQAMESTAASIRLAPENKGYAEWRAWALEAAGNLEQAWDLVNRLMAGGYLPASVLHLYSRLAERHGKQQHALELIERALAAPNAGAGEKHRLYLAAAKLLDRGGQFDRAFAMAASGNALCKPHYDPSDHRRAFDRLIDYFTPRQLRCLPRAAYRKSRPVFVVGMPRSGTSLLEQILASHPMIHGAGELDFLDRVMQGTLDMLKAGHADYPACLNGLSIDDADGMAQIYLEPLNALSPSAARIVDKMPLNFMHLGLIALLLPEARIIHCRRDGMDTCLSCYMTCFAGGNAFKHDLAHLGAFYRQYERLMDHWKQVLDLPVLEVSYEELVGQTEATSRRMIDFLGLPWDERCLRHHEHSRPVSTASVEQVRRPVYGSSVSRWRHYEKHLGKLAEILGA